jgi:HAD superfamily phosphoserine phosphatase-like hydrolase
LAAYLTRRIRDDQLKQALIRDYLACCDAEHVAEHAAWFCQRWLPRFLHPVGVPLLEAHRACGDRLVLLSAGPSVFVPQVAATLGIAEVICTTIEQEAGRWTGTIVGGNCKGGRKLQRLQDYLGGSQPPPRSFAYGDSRSDRFVLEWVEHGVWIRRRRWMPYQTGRKAGRLPFGSFCSDKTVQFPS